MSASEFAFLALGLVLGLASGAAIVEVLRARPPAPREVRLTLTPDSVPRRPSTLAGPVVPSAIGPAAFGPADRRTDARPRWGTEAAASRRGRTGVPSVAAADELAWPMVGIAIEPEPDRVLAALRATPAAAAAVPTRGMTVTAFQDDGALHARSDASEPDAGSGGRPGGGSQPAARGGSGADDPARADPTTDGCSDLRRLVAERCAVAELAAAEAEAATSALRERQRESDERETRAARAAAEADPSSLRAAKEAAQEEFRRASAAAADPATVETAARTWLQEINRVNGRSREAAVILQREREAVNALVPVLERLSVAADAARINAEGAREACFAVREAVAACEEAAGRERDATAAAARERDTFHVTPPAGEPTGSGPIGTSGLPDDGAAAGTAPGPEEEGPRAGPRVLSLLLGGDGASLRTVVVAVAGDDAQRQGDLQVQLSELVDAIRARAIEASYLDFPVETGFWEPFTRGQSREIAGALASLGYRFDGLGGFSDGRVPGQRDLSLAVGFAGLDPMRIRRWPNEAEMADLFREVTVAADEYVAANAPGLGLGEMVAMLGRRADALAELWNEWGRVRPLLIAPA